MSKFLLLAVLMSCLLCVGLVSSVHALGQWSENFSEFLPVSAESGYSFDGWTENWNSSNANVTYTYSSADGLLSVAEHCIGIPTATQTLAFVRNVTFDGSATTSVRFCMNNIHAFELRALRSLGTGATRFDAIVWQTATSHGDKRFFFKYLNVTQTVDVYTATDAIVPTSWYVLEVGWISAPNSYAVTLEEEGNEVLLLNFTVTDNLYDNTDVKLLALTFGGENTVSLGRVQIDYVRNGLGGGGLGGMGLMSFLPIMLELAIFGLLIGMFKKFGRSGR